MEKCNCKKENMNYLTNEEIQALSNKDLEDLFVLINPDIPMYSKASNDLYKEINRRLREE